MVRLSFWFFCVLSPLITLAYPDMVRHGYSHCTACHVSPSGGGLLTSYGRELSKELISTWGKDGEQAFAYGKFSSTEENIFGAFIRAVQTRREDTNSIVGRAIPMQLDFDMAFVRGQTTTVLSIGRQELRQGQQSAGRLFSRRHYVLQQANEETAWRMGKFAFVYGLGDPNHTSYVRKDLGFAYDSESYNLEYSYLAEELGVYVTLFDGQLTRDPHMLLLDRGLTATIARPWRGKHRFGLSSYWGEESASRRQIVGPWYLFSLLEDLYLTGEINYQNKVLTSGTHQFGWVTTQKLNYQAYKGLIVYISYDKKYLNQQLPSSEQFAYGTGIQFFPRPHWEIHASWMSELTVSSQARSDIAWLMMHFYL